MAVTTSRLPPGRMPNPFANVDRGGASGSSSRGLIVSRSSIRSPSPAAHQRDAARSAAHADINNLIVMTYYATLALGLNIVVGFAGLLDLGYVAFFVFGAYTTAFLASPHFGVHIPWWIVVVIAVSSPPCGGSSSGHRP